MRGAVWCLEEENTILVPHEPTSVSDNVKSCVTERENTFFSREINPSDGTVTPKESSTVHGARMDSRIQSGSDTSSDSRHLENLPAEKWERRARLQSLILHETAELGACEGL